MSCDGSRCVLPRIKGWVGESKSGFAGGMQGCTAGAHQRRCSGGLNDDGLPFDGHWAEVSVETRGAVCCRQPHPDRVRQDSVQMEPRSRAAISGRLGWLEPGWNRCMVWRACPRFSASLPPTSTAPSSPRSVRAGVGIPSRPLHCAPCLDSQRPAVASPRRLPPSPPTGRLPASRARAPGDKPAFDQQH